MLEVLVSGCDIKLPVTVVRVPPSRWVVPANGSITVRLRFMAVEPGEYDEVLNLKIAWTQTVYQLHCRCLAGFPNVSREPRYTLTCTAHVIYFMSMIITVWCS